MINPASVIALAFLVFLLFAMYFTFIAERYDEPQSYRNSLVRNLKGSLWPLLGFVIGNVIYVGFELGSWRWDFMAVIAIAIVFWLLVDFIVVSRRQRGEVQ